jgi:hypothetical protein
VTPLVTPLKVRFGGFAGFAVGGCVGAGVGDTKGRVGNCGVVWITTGFVKIGVGVRAGVGVGVATGAAGVVSVGRATGLAAGRLRSGALLFSLR